MSDHYDGKVFSCVEPIRNKNFRDILKWNFTSQRASWPEWVDIGNADKPPHRVDGKDLRASFVNHSTVLLQTSGVNILTDPVWSKRASPLSFMGPKRVHAPGINWADLPKIDVVLISHSHYDHLDIPTVKKLVGRDNPVLIMPLGVDTIIKRHMPDANCIVMDWGQSFSFNTDIIIYVEPAQHWSSRSFNDRNKTLWAGFVLKTPFGKTYYAGDTGYGTGKIFRDIFKKHGAVDFALIPIGAYEPRWFMKDSHANPEEAVQIFRDIQARQAMAIHYATFQLTDEAIDAPVQELSLQLKKAGIPVEKFRALKSGQNWLLN
jgi:L-ascorbate metabolism protein UlaG (beta-lactamase superfamily)